jgi:beta-galactosidase
MPQNSEVWINGHWLGKRPNGYISFVYDLTPYLQEGKNQIAVKVDHSKALTGRWYTGSGIYRPVYLLVSNPTHIPYSGIHFRSKLQNKQSATYTLSIEIETQEKKPIKVKTYLQAPNGSIADTSEKIFVSSADSLCFLSGSIRKPLLWSPDSPNVYTLICQLTRDNKILDECRLPVGFRQLEFNPVSGFLLNGKSLKIKGVCDHHTVGAVGAAVPDDLLHYRLKLLKDMGCNAIRTSHNPFSPAFYNLCDTMGIMVLNEGLDGWNQPKAADDYGNYFDEWWQKDMTDFIKRDRNHPSIIMWSIGNEVTGATPEIGFIFPKSIFCCLVEIGLV